MLLMIDPKVPPIAKALIPTKIKVKIKSNNIIKRIKINVSISGVNSKQSQSLIEVLSLKIRKCSVKLPLINLIWRGRFTFGSFDFGEYLLDTMWTQIKA